MDTVLNLMIEIQEARFGLCTKARVHCGLRHVMLLLLLVLLCLVIAEVMEGLSLGGILWSHSSVKIVSVGSWYLASCYLQPLHFFSQCVIQCCR